MRTKQLIGVCLCMFVIWAVGNGLMPLLPVYAIRLGTKPALIGFYLSFIFFTLAIGTVAAGWLSDRFQERKTSLIVAGIATVPALWLMGQVANIWQLTVLTAVVWFLAGIDLTLLRILTGLFAEKTKRGKIFGILALSNPLGTILGGFTTGPIVDRWGYPTLFTALAFFWCLLPFTALFLEDKVMVQKRQDETSIAGNREELGSSFSFLLLASTAACIMMFVGGMCKSLVMDDRGFSAAAISGSEAIGGAIALPLPFLIGWFSDRVGRKRLLILCYLGATVGVLILVGAVSLWHFCIVAFLLKSLGSVNRTVGSALTTDLIPQKSLGRGMSLFTTTTWIAGIIGFAGTGYAVQYLGVLSTLSAGAFLPLIGITLLIPIRQVSREEVMT